MRLKYKKVENHILEELLQSKVKSTPSSHSNPHHGDYDFSSMLALVLADINMAANPILINDNNKNILFKQFNQRVSQS